MVSARIKLNEVFGLYSHVASACRSIAVAPLNGPDEAVGGTLISGRQMNMTGRLDK